MSSGTVEIMGIALQDLKRHELVETISDEGPCTIFAFHVGGLTALRHDQSFISALDSADIVYADGVSIVLLAKLAGASRIERAPTTDIGHDVVAAMQVRQRRPIRVALVGGVAGLADRAGAVLQQSGNCRIVYTANGFDDLSSVPGSLVAAAPDLTFVGLGMPREATWVHEHAAELPGKIMTCGGWFGFLAAQERRAPDWAQKIGLEWVFRLAQDPKRLAFRYFFGLISFLRACPSAIRSRVS